MTDCECRKKTELKVIFHLKKYIYNKTNNGETYFFLI